MRGLDGRGEVQGFLENGITTLQREMELGEWILGENDHRPSTVIYPFLVGLYLT